MPPPDEVIEIMLAEKFHWTLDHIRSLSKTDLDRIFIVMHAKNMAEKKNRWTRDIDSRQTYKESNIQSGVRRVSLLKHDVDSAEELM